MREILTGSNIFIAVPPSEKFTRPPGVLRAIGSRKNDAVENVADKAPQSRREKAGLETSKFYLNKGVSLFVISFPRNLVVYCLLSILINGATKKDNSCQKFVMSTTHCAKIDFFCLINNYLNSTLFALMLALC